MNRFFCIRLFSATFSLMIIIDVNIAISRSYSESDSLLALRCVDHMAREEYTETSGIADSLLRDNPSSMMGWFIKASLYNARSVDYEDFLDFDSLYVACDSVIAIANRYLESKPDDPANYFFIGAVIGYRTFQKFRNGDQIGAVMEGLESIKWLKKSIDADSTFWDSYLGYGNYLYHRSAKAGLLRKTGIISDRRQEGLALIRLAAESGTFTKVAAHSSLAWLAIEEGQYDSAEFKARELLKQYPQRRSFMWCLGKALMKGKKWEEAIPVYQVLLESVKFEDRNNHFNEIGCLHSLAMASANLENWKDAVHYAEMALEIELSDEVAERKKKDIRNLKHYLKEGRKKLG